MTPRKPLLLGQLALAAASLTACSSLFGAQPVKITPVENLSSQAPAQSDPLYEGAVTAINDRDYGRALNYLQEAKAGNPSNIKVLNALGVVYDKLGRFDLSARYYAQARALNPNSRIVAANMEYSKVLQGLQDPGPHSAVAALETADGKSLPAQGPVALQPPAAQMAVAAAPIAVSPPRAAISAPVFQPVASPVVTVALPPEAVAPAASDGDRKATLPQVAATPAASFPRPQEKQTVASLNVPVTKPKTATAEAPTAPALAIPVLSKQPAVLPIHVASAVQPASRQTAALPTPPRTTPETHSVVEMRKAMMDATIESAATTPVLEKQPAVLPVRVVTVTPTMRPVEKPIAVLLTAPKPATEPKRPVIAAANPPVTVAQHAVVGKEPAMAPKHDLARVATAASPEKRAIALPVRLADKTSKPAAESRIAPPAASLKTPVPTVPVKLALAAPGHGKVLTIGKPVKILNASGKPGGTGIVSHRLTMLGWSIKQFDLRMQPVTTLYYPAKNIVAAKAMLRTLPFPARFISDNDDSFAMRLVIGRDFLSWKPRNARLVALWQKGQVLASLQRPLMRGVP